MRHRVLGFCTLVFNFQRFPGVPVKLGLLFIAALSLTLAMSSDNSAVAEMFFQSPQSPASPPAPPQPEVQPNPEQPAEQTQPATLGDQQTETQPAVNQNNNQPAATPLPRQSRRQSDSEIEDDAPKSNNFILDRGELVDTVMVYAAYVWLCCGIILILILPLAFLFLHIRGRRKIIKEDIP